MVLSVGSPPMESKPPRRAPGKLLFKPKAPTQRLKTEVKIENEEETVAAEAMKLRKRFEEMTSRKGPKAEKIVRQKDIAFCKGAEHISLKPYRRVDPKVDDSVLEDIKYVEPWDYNSYYPLTLPMRTPYSGNPATLDKIEFSEASAAAAYDEDKTNCAAELGLLEENEEPSFLFLQLPPTVPMQKRQTTAADGQEKDSSRPSGGGHAKEKPCRLDELPAGFMGKMLVYKSGAVKLKLGDTIYDVSPGMNCVFAQDVVAVNTSEKTCCVISEIHKRATLTPDFDSILSNVEE